MKYAFIAAQVGTFSIVKMCRWLSVSRSGFYRWRSRTPSQRSKQREQLRAAVLEVYQAYKKRYGAPRITEELKELGISCSLNHVAQLMQEAGVKARNGKSFRYGPSAEAMSNVADNLLARNFKADKPNEKWVSDITFIRVDGEWLHLAVIMDLFSRQIIGWAVDETMTTELIVEAFNMAVERREVAPGLILHSDRGVQYRSGEYQQALADHQITPSMSRKGNCWDNAAMESFFSRLKVELIYANEYTRASEVYQDVFEYIEVFYNRIRRHSANGYLSPVNYEAHYHAQCA